MIADEDLGRVVAMADIPRLLLQHGMLDPGLAQCWTRMIGLRNVLVHQYLDIDRRLVYDSITQRLGDLQGLKQVFARLL